MNSPPSKQTPDRFPSSATPSSPAVSPTACSSPPLERSTLSPNKRKSPEALQLSPQLKLSPRNLTRSLRPALSSRNANAPDLTREYSLHSVNLESDFFPSVDFDNEDLDEDEGAVRAASVAKQLARQLAVKPNIEMLPYGSLKGNGWALGPTTLLHNSIRRELVDVYSCIMSMERRANFGVAQEMMELIIWWNSHTRLLSGIFDLQNTILFKSLFREATSTGIFQGIQEKVIRSQKALQPHIDEIEPLLVKFRDAPSSFLYDVMILKVDSTIKLTLEHLTCVENTVGPIAVTKLSPAEMQSIEARLVAKVLEDVSPGDIFSMLVRPMSSAERNRFVTKYLDSAQNSAFKSVWRHVFEQGHTSIPARFRSRFEEY